ncbi:MAG TPA: PHB depolymerase family esterase [Phototrophicaceae bacterium]|nr:PHB depolymerase family esterase [Phototrophicaceae bacterium]
MSMSISNSISGITPAIFSRNGSYKLIVFPLMICLLSIFVSTQAQSDSQIQTLVVDGLERTYQLYVPETVTSPAPLVIVLHGGGGDSTGVRQMTHFDDQADDAGFIVVYPDGLEEEWNDGRVYTSQHTFADDVNFIHELINTLEAQYQIDSSRIYATGISNGGFMSMTLACDLADQITAVGVVSAGLSVDLQPDCHPARPVSVIILNGTDDPIVPYDGGAVHVFRLDRGATLSTDDTVQFWVGQDACTIVSDEIALPDVNRRDRTQTYLLSYTGCTDEVQVQRYRIEGGGHTWAGGVPYLPRAIVGRVSQDFSATEVIWNFFSTVPPIPDTGN